MNNSTSNVSSSYIDCNLKCFMNFNCKSWVYKFSENGTDGTCYFLKDIQTVSNAIPKPGTYCGLPISSDLIILENTIKNYDVGLNCDSLAQQIYLIKSAAKKALWNALSFVIVIVYAQIGCFTVTRHVLLRNI